MKYILNALPLGAVNGEVVAYPVYHRQPEFRTAKSAIGHADFAAAVSALLGYPVAYNRETIALCEGDEALVLAYSGPRLPEGCTEFPAEGKITCWMVRVMPRGTTVTDREDAAQWREAVRRGNVVRRGGINETDESRAVELARITEMLGPQGVGGLSEVVN